MNERIRFAIVGTGKRSDTLYAPLLNTLKEDVELVGVWGRFEFINNGTVNPNAVSNNVWTDAEGTFSFNNNLWYRVEGGLRFQWGSRTTIAAWSGWQAKGFDTQGYNANPLIAGPWGGGPNAYLLQSTSLAINHARIVTEALRGMGTRDYFGTTTPQGGAYDIGTAEHP